MTETFYGTLVEVMEDSTLDPALRSLAALRLIAWRQDRMIDKAESIKYRLGVLVAFLVVIPLILGGCTLLF